VKHPLTLLAATVLTVGSGLASRPAAAAPLTLSPVPLFASTTARPNVLLTFANSNSMDEDATGLAVGSASANSKSEIARSVAKALVAKYTGSINMGLEAFQQTTGGGDPVTLMYLHSSPYDVSFDPADYNPAFTGNRSSQTKKFRAPNVSTPGLYVYYNVNLPFYAGSNQGNGFCYSNTANAAANVGHPTGFNNGEVLWGGPWDSYRCFNSKNNTSNNLPPAVSDGSAGYGGLFYQGAFFPTDSDLGQGITDFGRFITWNYVSPTWFSNGSPGKGYIHIPIAALDSTQAGKFNTKLGTSQFATNQPMNAAYPLQNAGLTPLQGSLQTANSYFAGTLGTSEGGALAAPPNSCGRNYNILLTNGLPSVKADGTPSSDVTTMLSDASTAAANLRTQQSVLTYVVGFALPYGVNPTQLDTIAASGGTGTAYNATDAATLTAQLDAIFADILRRAGAASSVALNSSSANTGNYVYQAKFDAGSNGQLLAYPIQSDGSLAVSPSWDAGQVLNGQDASSGRAIITYKPSNGAGVRFRWPVDATSPSATELDLAQVTALNTNSSGTADARGSGRLDWLRGVRTQEGGNTSTQFRQRSSVLGDIVNSAPAYVDAPGRNSRRNARDATYQAFRDTMASRPSMIYVGANDGLLHGFRASDGVELLAYMPSQVYSNLSKLTSQSYSHQYYVDGTPEVADAKFSTGWRSVLVSGLNAGGKGIFALDVTDPGTFSEVNADALSLWEFGTTQDTSIGYVFDSPTIVKLNNGQWAAVFGNGYNNSGTGQAGIFIVNIETGALIKRILTGVGDTTTPNGVGRTAVVDLDGNGTADAVYGGDLRGNLWKFDLSDTNSTNWAVAFSGSPLFNGTVSGNPQPITAAPEVTAHPSGGYMVMFGTGQYLATGDPTTTTQQSLYGVRDNGSGNLTRSNLVAQTITTTTVSGVLYRNVSTNTVDWSSMSGWYVDLPSSGERVAVDPVLRNGRAIFVSLVPNTDPCAAGGTGWLMEIDYLTGGQLPIRTLDTNGDNLVSAADALVAGKQLAGISSAPAIQTGYGSETAPLENKYLNQSSGNVATVRESSSPFSSRRMSWRQER
jgi:type IV pilus assembly protein PilY1